jgi:carotenoid cleavage dioxygenase-like enzyme
MQPADLSKLPPMQRRSFLKAALMGAGAIGMPAGLLSACGSSSNGEAPLVVDPDLGWWLQNNFAPTFEEVTQYDLPVRGSIPPELNGSYIRNGSNPQNTNSPHWFLGDGMVHGVHLENGRALSYKNRYVQTELYKGEIAFDETIDSGLAPGGANGTSNVSTYFHGGKLLSLGEIGAAFELDPKTLETIGLETFGGAIPNSMTAHPKIDPETGNLHCFGYWFVAPHITYWEISPSGEILNEAVIETEKPTMVHSFAITDREVVFWECPVVFDIQNAIENPIDAFMWTPEYGARIGVLAFGDSGDKIRWVDLPEPCFVFHETNAHRDGDDIHIDVHWLQEVFNKSDLATGEDTIRRWTVNTAGEELTFRDQIISDNNWDLPKIDPRYVGRPYQHSWHAEFRDHPDSVQLGGIAYMNNRTGEGKLWTPPAHIHAAEAIFVPTGSGEGDGYLLSYLYNSRTNTSTLGIFEALNHTRGPIAEVVLDVRVPYGFHGTWVPSDYL